MRRELHQAIPCLRAVIALTSLLVHIANAKEQAQNNALIRNGGFEDGASGWAVFGKAAIERGNAYEGEWRLTTQCTAKDGSAPSGAKLTGIAVKSHTGYVARCRLRLEKWGAHHTFGILKSDGTFLACRDGYTRRTADHWGESILAFRTGEENRIGIHVGRRYGKGEIWFDAIELTEDNSVRIGDVSPRPDYPFPTATAVEQRRGVIAAARNWMQLLYPSMYPARSDTTPELTCRLAPNEYEPLTFSLTALRALENVSVSVPEDLRGPGGAVLPAGKVAVGVVRTITRWLTSAPPLQPGQRYERRPLFVFPNHSVHIPARETQQFWLTVFAPPDLPPGRYTGVVTVSAKETEAFGMPLHIDVLPIMLAAPEVTYGMYYRYQSQMPEFKTKEFFERSLADMKAHGMNSFSVYADLTEKKPDGTLLLNPDGGSPYNHKDRSCGLNWQMGLLDKAGLLSPNHPLLLLADWSFYNNRDLVAALKAYGIRNNWPEFLIYLVDEPSSPKQIEQAKRLNDLVHTVDGVRTVTAMGKAGELAAYYDVWITTGSLTADEAALAQKHGKEPWTYICTWNGNQPRNDRFYAGYNTWTQRLRGNWLWCYTEGVGLPQNGEIKLRLPGYEDPWNVTYVLPSRDANIATLGWEARREGVDDYRYLQTLRDAVQEALAANDENTRRTAREAQCFLEDVERRTRIPSRETYCASYPEYVYAFLMHPDLEPEDYEGIRRQAAEHIVELQGRAR